MSLAAVVPLVGLLVVCGCSGSSAPTQTVQSGPPASLIAMPTGAHDVVVAKVNGRPVYGACVTTQLTRGATKQQALEQCVDFELLAQLAESFATDAEVIDATKTALVSTLVARDYEDKFTKPADFGAYWDRSIERNRIKIVHGEARASAYVRIAVATTATPAEDAAAHALADELAAAFAPERGLLTPHLDEIAKRVIGTRAKYEVAAVPPRLDNGSLVPEYSQPLFKIAEVGRSSPAVRTPWGWDVIVLTEILPAASPTPDEIAAKALPEVKRSYFPLWATQVAQKLGLSIKIYDDKLPLMEELL